MAKNYSYHSPGNSGDNDNVKFVGENGCCNMSCLKFTLYIFNFLLFSCGLILIGVGLFTLLEKHPSLFILSSGYYDFNCYVLIVAGGLVLLTSVVGCCALSKGSSAVTCCYITFLVGVLILELSGFILAYFYRSQINAELADNLNQAFNIDYSLNNDTTYAVDNLQVSLSCCGVHTFKDWTTSAWWESDERRNNKVPDSCCISPSPHCGTRDHPSNIRYTGCIDKIEKIAGDQLVIVGAVALGICIIQLIGTFLAVFYRCKLTEDDGYFS